MLKTKDAVRAAIAVLAFATAVPTARSATNAAPSAAAPASTGVVARLLAPFGRVRTLSATMTRVTTPAGGRGVKTLSTVFFARPDRFHSETVAPFHRVAIADGKELRVYIDGTPRGMLRPISGLSPEMLASIRAVPGTPGAELAPFEGGEASRLPAPAPPYASSYSVRAGGVRAVLDLDAAGRLARMSVAPEGAAGASAVFEYSDYAEAAPGVWIPRLHRSTVLSGGREAGTAVLRVEDLAVNETIPASFFNPDAFFRGVRFCADPADGGE